MWGKMLRTPRIVIYLILLMGVGLVAEVVPAASQGLEITELQDAKYVGVSRLLKWSPDGSKLVFAHYDTLVVLPIKGEPHKLTGYDGSPFRMEWIDNRRLAIQLRQQIGHVHNQCTLLEIDTETDSREILETYEYSPAPVSEWVGQKTFDGPYRSLEGRPYYVSSELTGNLVSFPNGRRAETIDTIVWLDDPTDYSTKSQYNGYKEWNGIKYLINVNGLDSIRIAFKSELASYWPSNVSHDLRYVSGDGFVKRIDNKTNIDLRPLIGTVVKGQLGCGFFHEAFAPNADLLLFGFSCDGRQSNSADSVEYEITVDHVGLYDITRDKLHVIDTLVGAENCYGPAFSPSGDRIAVRDEKSVLHILNITANE